MGGDQPSKLFATVLARKRVMRAEFNTCTRQRTVSYVHSPGIFLHGRRPVIRPARTSTRKLNRQNTELIPKFNPSFALTPPKSVAIISVSVRSAELRLVVYV